MTRRRLERATRLRHDLRADLGHEHALLAALEEVHAQLVLDVADRRREARLADEAAPGRAAEVALLGDRDEVPRAR